MSSIEDIPMRMQAYCTHAPGLPPYNASGEKLITPKPAASQVLVKILYASFSPGAIIMTALFPGFLHKYPSIQELDFAGVVVCLGENAKPPKSTSEGVLQLDGFQCGEYVFGSVTVGQHLKGVGSLAQYVAIATCQIAHVPGSKTPGAQRLSEQEMAEAASLPVSGCTALTLSHAAQLLPGMSVLVNGASGGVGTLILQMVKHAVGETGKVTAVCSSRNVNLVKALGADEVVAYDALSTDFGISVDLIGVCSRRGAQPGITDGRFDVVIDAVGKQEIWHNCTSILKDKGAYVTVGPGAEAWTRMALLKTLGQMAGNILTPKWLGGVGRRYIQVANTVGKKDLLQLKRLVEEGVLTGVVEKTFGWHAADIVEVSNLDVVSWLMRTNGD